MHSVPKMGMLQAITVHSIMVCLAPFGALQYLAGAEGVICLQLNLARTHELHRNTCPSGSEAADASLEI
jgi:hypothetical protein